MAPLHNAVSRLPSCRDVGTGGGGGGGRGPLDFGRSGKFHLYLSELSFINQLYSRMTSLYSSFIITK